MSNDDNKPLNVSSDSESETEKKAPETFDSSDSSYDYEEVQEEAPKDEPSMTKDEPIEGKDEPGTLVELQSPVAKMTERVATWDRKPKPMPKVAPGQPLPRRIRFVPNYDVEGTYKLCLSEDTQIYVEIVIGHHVSVQFPWKTVDKAKIMECIEMGGENSEFYPFKEELQDYPHDKVLMGYVTDSTKDEDEFYICVTTKARDHCKQQNDRYIHRQERKLEKKMEKKPRPWTCLGSDNEIISLRCVDTRPLMEVEIKAVFPTLYDPDKFNVREVLSVRDGYIELTPYRQKFNIVQRRRIDNVTQVGLPKESRAAQTILRYPKNMWTQSIADALGKYNPNETVDDLLKVEKDSDESSSSSSGDEMVSSMPFDETALAPYKAAFARLRRASYIKLINQFMEGNKSEMENVIELNSVMDIYSNDYPALVMHKTSAIYDTMTFEEYVCFTDVRNKDKYIACAAFHPMWTGIVAICYADGSPNIYKFVSPRPDPIQRAVYGLNPVMIWSHIDSLRPKLYLMCTREVKSLAFCPFDENLLIGGCINGQVVIWDLKNKLENVEKMVVLTETREKYRIAVNSHMTWMKPINDNAIVPSTAMSSLLTSHYGAITSIGWLSPNFTIGSTGIQQKLEEDQKRSSMIFTGSEDGTILIWNLSTENVVFLEGKKIKKSKRVPEKPAGLMTDLSPYKVLDRNLQPCYKIILGKAGKPQILPVQVMQLVPLVIKYIYLPGAGKDTGRKYFTCEVKSQQESEMSNNILIGTQHGTYANVTWEGKAFNTGELVNSEFANVVFKCNIHDGIVGCSQRNPFINSLSLTVGGKIFAIWSDDLPGRPLIWKKRSFRLTDGKWSLYKPSIMFIVTAEGNLETWDLLLRSDQPIAVQTVSGSGLTGVSVHSLPCPKNIIGVSDSYGSFKMFIDPPIFMLSKERYLEKMKALMEHELHVMHSFINWQELIKKNNPHILLEMARKEGALLAEKEEEKRKMREEEEKRLEEEAEAKRLAKLKVIGPVEKWEMIVNKLIERAIAVKKRINKAELIEHEKPLRELEVQRLEKERKMLEITKNQQNIFNDTVAILFPEAIQKPAKVTKSYLDMNIAKQKQVFLTDYEYIKGQAFKTVHENPYKTTFSWESTLAEGKERRLALSPHENFIKFHKNRIEEGLSDLDMIPTKIEKSLTQEVEDEDVEKEDIE